MTYKIKKKQKNTFVKFFGVGELSKIRKRQKKLSKKQEGRLYDTKIKSWGIHPYYKYDVNVYFKNGKLNKTKSKTFNTIKDAKAYSSKIRKKIKK